VSDEGESGDQKQEDSSPVLGVAVNLSGHTHESQKAGSFEEAD
jgi:hypothetical protein